MSPSMGTNTALPYRECFQGWVRPGVHVQGGRCKFKGRPVRTHTLAHSRTIVRTEQGGRAAVCSRRSWVDSG